MGKKKHYSKYQREIVWLQSPLQRYIVCDSNFVEPEREIANWIKLFIWPWNWRIFVYFWYCASLKICMYIYVYGTHFEIVSFFFLLCMKLSIHSHGLLCGARKHQFSSLKLILILPLPDIDLFAHCVCTHTLYQCTMQTFDVLYRFPKPTRRLAQKAKIAHSIPVSQPLRSSQPTTIYSAILCLP